MGHAEWALASPISLLCLLLPLALSETPISNNGVVSSASQLLEILLDSSRDKQPGLVLHLHPGPLTLSDAAWPADGVVPEAGRVQIAGAGWGLEQATVLDFSMLPKVSIHAHLAWLVDGHMTPKIWEEQLGCWQRGILSQGARAVLNRKSAGPAEMKTEYLLTMHASTHA
eukprot:scaffold277728_cov18-Tisochrysis_lutea.AAC.1